MSSDRRARRGFTLLETLVVVVVAAIALSAGLPLFTRIMRSTDEQRRAGEQLLVIDRITDQLRADVWASYNVAVGNDRTLLLRMAGERSVTWSVSATESTVRRTELEGLDETSFRQWPTDVTVRFERSAAGVTMVLTSKPWPRPARVRLVSCLQLVKGAE